jgi:hypothetical protein
MTVLMFITKKMNQVSFSTDYLGVPVKIASHDEFTDENLDTIFSRDNKKRMSSVKKIRINSLNYLRLYSICLSDL